MPSWFGSSNNEAPTSSSNFGGFSGGGGGGGARGGAGTWTNLEVPGQIKNSYGELTGENSQFAEWGFQLSRRDRLIGFCSCLVAGFALSLLGAILTIVGGAYWIAIFFSLGIITSLVGTGFLIGFAKQLKQMFKPVRVVATAIMLASLIMVYISAFLISGAVALIFVVVLYFAYIWYSLSYIPYARDFVKSMFSKMF